MSQEAGSSRAYRNPTVQDDSDDDDLDDLDDVLAAFDNKASTRATGRNDSAPAQTNAAVAARKEDDGDDDFEASLAGEMELLLKQLAGAHIPGPMPDNANGTPGLSSDPAAVKNGATKADGDQALSPEDEEAAWQKAIEMMLSNEGMSALGLDKDENGAGPSRPSAPRTTGDAKPASFDEAIRRTMEQLGSKDKRTGGVDGLGGGDVPPDLAALLAKLSVGDLGGEDGDDDELGGLLDGMMSQLMTKEVLEEPMAELASKYPAYLANPPSDVSPTDLEKYRKQHKLVNRIVATFQKPNFSDDTDGKDVARLVSEMQDLGGPPKEIMGDLPDGMDLAGLGGDEACVIM